MWKDLHFNNIAFTLIDFQTGFSPLMDPQIFSNARSNVQLITKMFRRAEVPLIGTEHYRKGLGPTDPILLEAWGENPMLDKITFSCCGQDSFVCTLEKFSRRVVVLAGLETHICVLQTALDLLDRNYKVITVTDAVLSSSKDKWKSGLNLMEKAGAELMTTETLLFYLLKRADTPDFKYLVQLLKEKKNSNQ
ncbi:MAG: isochorismatase family protein [Oligoflexia bacterium]|nr:isochorismatase family protein [Oligoflexia bacterium]MBF0364237.1 isochorismatase family protein [Oligoflexia bacterium]